MQTDRPCKSFRPCNSVRPCKSDRPCKSIRPCKIKLLTLVCAILMFGCGGATEVEASPERSESFYPTWKLLSNEQKQQFIAGYVLALKDAARITDIALQYSQSDPSRAMESLQKIRSLFDIFETKPTVLVKEIDTYYTSPINRSATLSMAVNAARGNINTVAR